MNIAVFTKKTTFHKGYGGLETQNKLLCEGLSRRGHKVTVFSPDWGANLEQKTDAGVNYIFVKCVYRMGPVFGFFGSLQKNNWLNRSYEEFYKIHQNSKFDLVLAQSSTGLGIIKKKNLHGAPVISIAHGSIIGEYKTFLSSMVLPKDIFLLIKNTGFMLKNFFRRQRDFVNGSNKVIAVSEQVRQALLDETFTDDARIEVVNNGIDPTPFFKQNEDIKRGKKLIYIGQVIKSKGVDEIVNFFNDSRFGDFEVDIIGDGELLPELKEKVARVNSLNTKVHFIGKVAYEQLVASFYKNLEYGVFIFPTKRFEGLPMVLVEALFSGLPVVAYENGGVSSAVFNGETGYLVPAGNSVEFKNKILEIISDDNLRESMCKKSLKNAYENFTIDTMLDKYEEVFRKVIK